MAYQRQAKKIVPASASALLGSQWLTDHAQEVYTNYPEEWIAASASGLIAHNHLLPEVMKEIEAHDLKPEDVAVKYTLVGTI